MALETVIFQKDPFIYSHKDHNNCDIQDYASSGLFGLDDLHEDPTKPKDIIAHDQEPGSSICCVDNINDCSASPATVEEAPSRRKRRRSKSTKNKEEIENQRMTHIAVERNRRRQMNDYLATLRSMMPPSYAQRGDQASIVGGAINFVKELEQHVHFLEAHNRSNHHHNDQTNNNIANTPSREVPFSNAFAFPQYTTTRTTTSDDAIELAGERRSEFADVEVTMAESHANIKILSKRKPKQLVKMVAGFQCIGLTVLHLNVTTVDQSVLYSFSVKVEEACQLTNVNDIASAAHDMLEMIQQESSSMSTL